MLGKSQEIFSDRLTGVTVCQVEVLLKSARRQIKDHHSHFITRAERVAEAM